MVTPAAVLQNLKFLVIDDSANMRLLISTVLKSLGAREIITAKNGGEGLLRLRAAETDIVICDWNMAPVDGIEFVRRLRTQNSISLRFLPIIMMTGYTERDRVTAARDAGITEFIAKPISAARLMARISAIINRPRPFVDSDDYFGPCRRRRRDEYHGYDRRNIVLLPEPWSD